MKITAQPANKTGFLTQIHIAAQKFAVRLFQAANIARMQQHVQNVKGRTTLIHQTDVLPAAVLLKIVFHVQMLQPAQGAIKDITLIRRINAVNVLLQIVLNAIKTALALLVIRAFIRLSTKEVAQKMTILSTVPIQILCE